MKLFVSVLGTLALIAMVLGGCAQVPSEAPPEEAQEPGEEEAQEPGEEIVEWRIHTPHTEGRGEYELQKEWANRLTEVFDGNPEVVLYPGRALGFVDYDMLRVVGQNIIEGFMWYPGYVSRDDPTITLTSPEMILYEREHFVAYAPFAYEMAKKEYADWGIRLSVYACSPACQCGTLMAKDPVNTLDGLRGKKIRTWSEQQVRTLAKLGVEGQMMSQGDIYLALKTGVLDGAIFGPDASLALSMHEVADYWAEFYQGAMIVGLATSDAAFYALPADKRDKMIQVENELIEKWAALAVGWEQDEYDDRETLKELGLNILDAYSVEERELLIQAGREVWRERAEEVGPEAVKYQQTLESYLEQVKP